MARYSIWLTLVIVVLVGAFLGATPTYAAHCTIAITKTSNNYLIVTVPGSVYDGEVILKTNERRIQKPIVAHGDCPGSGELVFLVVDCTNARRYEFEARRSGYYENDNNVPLYKIRGPYDDNFDGLDEKYKC